MQFSDFNLNKALFSALSDLGLEEATAIQAKTFAPIMSGKDVVGIAQTGTGKTFAFLLPTLRLWKFSKSPFPQILILVPTRELVAQIVEEVQKLTEYMTFQAVGVYGGTNIRTQKAEVAQGADLIVGTPGRLLDLLMDGVLKTKNLKRLIIDEVDEMFHLGFRTQLNGILDFLPQKRQNLMFSATLPEEVKEIIDNYSDYYQQIEAAPSGAPLENIDQCLYELENFNSKANMLEWLLNSESEMSKVLVFVSTKRMADALYDRMQPAFEDGVGIIHSSKSQNLRFATVERFQDGTHRFIIATDVIARGLDVSQVTHVVNFDLNDTPENYIHRIGRTGRAERKGRAISFVSEKESETRDKIEALMGQPIPIKLLPEEVPLSTELIDLEKTVEFVPFNNHKVKEHKPTGGTFHEKSDKNKKVNKRRDYEEEMKKKYKKQYKRRR